jgi:hypothetical protein
MESSYGLGLFGDSRRAVSGYMLHEALVHSPGCCIRALGGSRAREMQFTRFLDSSHVTVEEMAAQAGRDTARLAEGRHVLVIQDSSDIVVGGRKARAAGFGPVGKGGQLGGLCLHALLAVDADNGGVFGPVDVVVTNRTGGSKVTPHRSRALCERESQRWLDGAQTASRVLAQAKQITVVADRESDIYQGYAQCPANVHLLTRTAHDRRIKAGKGQPRLLYAFSDSLAVRRTIDMTIPAAPDRKKRKARLEVRFACVTLHRSRSVKASQAPAFLDLSLVDIREVQAPVGADPIHWRLLTTHAVTTIADALRMLGWYRRRWLIEEYFNVLKTGGMDIENARIGKPAPMINLTGAATIAAATIMKLKQARDGLTDDGLETVFERDDEPLFEVLTERLEGNTQKQKNPHRPGTLARAQWVIARLGGWNCYYGKPGPKTYKRGLAKFHNIKLGANLSRYDV